MSSRFISESEQKRLGEINSKETSYRTKCMLARYGLLHHSGMKSVYYDNGRPINQMPSIRNAQPLTQADIEERKQLMRKQFEQDNEDFVTGKTTRNPYWPNGINITI